VTVVVVVVVEYVDDGDVKILHRLCWMGVGCPWPAWMCFKCRIGVDLVGVFVFIYIYTCKLYDDPSEEEDGWVTVCVCACVYVFVCVRLFKRKILYEDKR